MLRDEIRRLVQRFGISSRFGWRWREGRYEFHNGLDIPTPIGTVIRVKPTQLLYNPYNGYYVWQSDGKDRVVLIHLHPTSRPDLGYVHTGNTGISTGPHLHVSVLRDGRYVDPEEWLAEGESHALFWVMLVFVGIAVYLRYANRRTQ